MSRLIYPAMLAAMLMLFAAHQRDRDGVYVPCSIAEISPDVPTKAREACRAMTKF